MEQKGVHSERRAHGPSSRLLEQRAQVASLVLPTGILQPLAGSSVKCSDCDTAPWGHREAGPRLRREGPEREHLFKPGPPRDRPASPQFPLGWQVRRRNTGTTCLRSLGSRARPHTGPGPQHRCHLGEVLSLCGSPSAFQPLEAPTVLSSTGPFVLGSCRSGLSPVSTPASFSGHQGEAVRL